MPVGLGFQIVNEDEFESRVSGKLLKIDKLEYMINNYIRNHTLQSELDSKVKKKKKLL